nr:hypothetical protein [Lactiplantibacillus plantarum]
MIALRQHVMATGFKLGRQSVLWAMDDAVSGWGAVRRKITRASKIIAMSRHVNPPGFSQNVAMDIVVKTIELPN